MSKHRNNELPPRQQEAVIALVSEGSIHRAANKSGIAERTMYRWLENPEFANAYREARREAFGQAIALVQRYAAMAVNTLAKVMTDVSATSQAKVAAAAAILRFGRQGIELDDLAVRVEMLEQATQEEQKKGRR